MRSTLAFRAGGHLLVLCNPYNPLGRVMEAAELDAIATVVDRHGGRVFADEIHAPLVFTGRRHVPYASRSDTTAAHTITATSASKAWNLAGLNCAQLIVSNDADRARLEELVPLLPHVASTLGAIASTAAYDVGGPWLADIRAYLDGNRALLAELLAAHLPAVGYTPQEGTYLALARLPGTRAAGRARRVLPRTGRRRHRRRRALRPRRRRLRTAQHRDEPADPHPHRRATGERGPRRRGLIGRQLDRRARYQAISAVVDESWSALASPSAPA